MVAYSLGRLARKSAVPIVRMKPITDLDFVCAIEMPMKETAITDQLVVSAKNDCELRRQTSLVPGEKFLQHAPCLLAGVWPERKTHEIAVCHEFRQPVDVFVLERPQNQSGRFQNHLVKQTQIVTQSRFIVEDGDGH